MKLFILAGIKSWQLRTGFFRFSTSNEKKKKHVRLFFQSHVWTNRIMLNFFIAIKILHLIYCLHFLIVNICT